MQLLKKPVTWAIIVASMAATSAHAALDSAIVDAVQAEVIGDAQTAAGAGFAVMAVVLGLSVGMALLGRFISKGARGG